MKEELIVVITGAQKGIGLALSNAFSNYPVKVIATARHYAFNTNITLSEKITTQQLDVSKVSSIELFFDWFATLNKPIHFFVNNAGVGIFKPITEINITEWNSMLETNLTGPFFCLQKAYPFLKLAKGARVIHMGSVSEIFSLQGNAGYAASKMGLRALSKIINAEWMTDNIFCTHVVLGATWTDMWNTRTTFSREDMLDVCDASKMIVDAVFNARNFGLRLDVMEIFPKKGVL